MEYWMYLSLWKEHGGSPGMDLYSVDTETGALDYCRKLDDKISFGCSVVDERKNILYVCNEDDKLWGSPCETGRIYGYKISPEDGSLTELFRRDTYCANPCYLSLDASGRYLVVVHTSAGRKIAKLKKGPDGRYAPEFISRDALLQLYAVNEDGSLGELLDVKQHEADPTAKFQTSIMHCVVFSPSGNLLAVCDKVNGHVYLYTIDRERGELRLLSRTMTDVPGASTRYCVFHPTKPYFVVNHEKMQDGRMAVSSFRYTEDGCVKKVCTVNVLPPDCAVPPKAQYEQQGLCISDDGHYVYSCLKGPNAIAVLALDEDGGLRVLQHISISGEWPRGLAKMPGGKYVVASCLVSGDLASYAVGEDGCLRRACSAAGSKGGAYMSFSQKAVRPGR